MSPFTPSLLSTLYRTALRFRLATGGATAIEYALIASLVAMVIISAVTGLGGSVQSLFNDTSDALQ